MTQNIHMPALCLDLDGTVRGSRSGAIYGPTSPEDVILLPHVASKVWAHRDAGHYIVGVTNQGVVGYGTKTETEVHAIVRATRDAFDRGDPSTPSTSRRRSHRPKVGACRRTTA